MPESKNIYKLPVSDYYAETATSDSDTHIGVDAHAIDFVVPEGSPVFAAADGEIIFVKVDSKEGGDNPIYEDFKFYNHIVIKHANGEYTEYGHLKFQGTDKKVGDTVKAGVIVALSGNTGYSEKPHLHFSVFVLGKMDDDFKNLPLNKEYFINDSDFGFVTIWPKFGSPDPST